MSMNGFEIVGFADSTNLRELNWNQHVLEKIKKEWKLNHGEAVVFCNDAQDRFRLVASFFGLPVLILPPVNQDDRISLYLKIALFLKKFRIAGNITSVLEEEVEHAEKRIDRRKRLAKNAASKRK